jgi:hypothetical protein
VKDYLLSGQGCRQLFWMQEVCLYQMEIRIVQVRGEMLPLSRAEVVQDCDILDPIVLQQPFHQMAADEAGAAGDKDRATFAHLAKKEMAKTKRFPLLLHNKITFS